MLIRWQENEQRNRGWDDASPGNVKIFFEARIALIPAYVESKRKKSAKKGSAQEKNLAEQAMRRCKSTMKLLEEKLGKARISLAQKEQDLFETEAEIKEVRKNSKLNEDFAKTETTRYHSSTSCQLRKIC